jgi:hypothetical protein
VDLAHYDEAVKHPKEEGEPKVVEAAHDREEECVQVRESLVLLEACLVLGLRNAVDYLWQHEDPRVEPGNEEKHSDRSANLVVYG